VELIGTFGCGSKWLFLFGLWLFLDFWGLDRVFAQAGGGSFRLSASRRPSAELVPLRDGWILARLKPCP
jgi:hypothetical protein